MALQFTGSIDAVGSITASAGFFGTASYALTASVALDTPVVETGSLLISASSTVNGVLTLTKGDGSTFDVTVDTSSGATNTTMSLDANNVLTVFDSIGGSVSQSLDNFGEIKTLNGVQPDATGNVNVSFTSVTAGLSASRPVTSNEGDVYVIDGETDPALTSSNGDAFIYSTSSAQWYDISPTDQTANDARYVEKSGDTMIGRLILNADPTVDLEAATKGYVDGIAAGEKSVETLSNNATASAWNYAVIVDNTTNSASIQLPEAGASDIGKEIYVWISGDAGANRVELKANSTADTINNQPSDAGIPVRAIFKTERTDDGFYQFAHVQVTGTNEYSISKIDDVYSFPRYAAFFDTDGSSTFNSYYQTSTGIPTNFFTSGNDCWFAIKTEAAISINNASNGQALITAGNYGFGWRPNGTYLMGQSTSGYLIAAEPDLVWQAGEWIVVTITSNDTKNTWVNGTQVITNSTSYSSLPSTPSGNLAIGLEQGSAYFFELNGLQLSSVVCGVGTLTSTQVTDNFIAQKYFSADFESAVSSQIVASWKWNETGIETDIGTWDMTLTDTPGHVSIVTV